jgi:hypothetical protein
VSGQAYSSGDIRYYKCWISSLGATSKYSVSDSGYRGFSSPTYQWQYSYDNGLNYSNISGGTGTTYILPAGEIASIPSIIPGTTSPSYNDYTDKVVLNLSSESYSVSANLYRCYLVGGFTYSVPCFRYVGDPTGAITYQWQMSAGDSDASYSNISGATTRSYNYINAPGDARYYKCKLEATGANTNYSPSIRGRRSPGLFPMG